MGMLSLLNVFVPPGADGTIIRIGWAVVAVGSLAWAAALSRLRAAVAALGLYVIPIGGAVASHIGLGEPLYARHAVGALIVIAAIVIGRSGSRAPLQTASET